MKKIIDHSGFGRAGILMVLITIAMVLAVFIPPYLHNTDSGPIKIGAILSLSGPGGGVSGEAARDGLLLAVDELNAWGGINGRKIELIIEDSNSNGEKGISAFNKIEEAHHPLLYVSTLSTVSMALAPIAEEKQVVLTGLVTANPNLTRGKDWVFRYYTTAGELVSPILTILRQLQVKTLGILYLDDEYGRSVFDLLKEKFEAAGGKTMSAAYDVRTKDFKSRIMQLEQMEAIYTIGFVNHLGHVIRQLKEVQYKGVILGSEGVGTLAQVQGMALASGVYFAAPIIYNPNYKLAKDIKEKFEARYHKPFTHPAANGYDFIKLLSGLLEEGVLDRPGLKAVLEKGFIYPGVFGSIEVKPGEHEIIFPLHPARAGEEEIEYLR